MMGDVIDLARYRATGRKIEVATCSTCGGEFDGGASRERKRKIRQRRIDAGKPVPAFLQGDGPAKLCPRCCLAVILRNVGE